MGTAISTICAAFVMLLGAAGQAQGVTVLGRFESTPCEPLAAPQE